MEWYMVIHFNPGLIEVSRKAWTKKYFLTLNEKENLSQVDSQMSRTSTPTILKQTRTRILSQHMHYKCHLTNHMTPISIHSPPISPSHNNPMKQTGLSHPHTHTSHQTIFLVWFPASGINACYSSIMVLFEDGPGFDHSFGLSAWLAMWFLKHSTCLHPAFCFLLDTDKHHRNDCPNPSAMFVLLHFPSSSGKCVTLKLGIMHVQNSQTLTILFIIYTCTVRWNI